MSLILLSCQVRESLTPLLGASLGTAVEASLFELQRGAGAVYKSQWRDIIANLKDPKNDLKSVGKHFKLKQIRPSVIVMD